MSFFLIKSKSSGSICSPDLESIYALGLIFNSSSVLTKLLVFELLLKITGSFDGTTPYRQTYFSKEAPSIIPGRSLF